MHLRNRSLCPVPCPGIPRLRLACPTVCCSPQQPMAAWRSRGACSQPAPWRSGSEISWGWLSPASKISALAESAANSDGVAFVPALAGLGSPHWDSDARGAILGITRGTTRAQIARAALESVAFRVREIVEAMESGGIAISELRADGGMTSSDVLMQIQANALPASGRATVDPGNDRSGRSSTGHGDGRPAPGGRERRATIPTGWRA